MAYNIDMPVVVATSSIALQQAIAQDYIPEISQILLEHGIISKPLTAIIRKSRIHSGRAYIRMKSLLSVRGSSTDEYCQGSFCPLG